jgi:PIN domain nuclease of toxin-antitoxin system
VILLLDAHALLWFLSASPELDPGASAAIADPANDVLVSAATVWEIAVKHAAGRLDAPEDLVATMARVGLSGLPFTGDDAERAARLPMHHRDPFDRMLIAQAVRLDAVIASRDRAFEAYDVNVLRT